MIKKEITLTLQVTGSKIKYGIRGDANDFKHLVTAIKNTLNLIRKKNKNLEEKRLLREISKKIQ